MSRLLKAYAEGRKTKSFDCPVTSVRVMLKQPVYRTQLKAEKVAIGKWGKRPLATVIDVRERESLVRTLLIGFSLFEEGEARPVGEDILGLGSDAIEAYDAVLQSIEDPTVEELTDDDVDSYIDLLKKKDPQTAAFLRLSEGSTAYALLRSMADRLSTSPTSNSSESGSSSDTPVT